MADPTPVQAAIDIANMAFLKLGVASIDGFEDDNERALLANATYTNIRDEVLRGHPWHFAMKYFKLTAGILDPAVYKWENAFDIPDGSVRVWQVQGQEAQSDDLDPYGWTTVGKQILTNLASVDTDTDVTSIQCICIMRIADVSLYDQAFIDCLCERLMAEWAEPIRRETTLTTAKEVTADRKEKRAWSKSSSEKTPSRLESDYFINSR